MHGPRWTRVRHIRVPREVEYQGLLIPHQHHGLLFEDERTGQYDIVHMVAPYSESDPARIEHVSETEFSGESAISVVPCWPGRKELPVHEVYRRALLLEAKRRDCFDFVDNNSEHFVTECLYGCRMSHERDSLSELIPTYLGAERIRAV